LKNYPATEAVVLKLTRDNGDRQLVAIFNTDILIGGLVEADDAELYINWWPQPVEYKDQFKFHYVESTGYDCGWHRQPHPEESEIPFDHFQQRTSPNDDYQYQSITFQDENPIGLLWEVLETRLPKIIEARDGNK